MPGFDAQSAQGTHPTIEDTADSMIGVGRIGCLGTCRLYAKYSTPASKIGW